MVSGTSWRRNFCPNSAAAVSKAGASFSGRIPPYDKEPAARIAQMMQAASEELAECADAVLVHSLAEIEAAKAAGKFYILAGAEGLSAIGDSLERLDRFYDFGVRHAMLTWNEENLLASGAKGDPTHGLTAFGRQVVQRMEEKRMIVDVSHLNDRSFWDVMDVVTKPVIASHSNARAAGGGAAQSRGRSAASDRRKRRLCRAECVQRICQHRSSAAEYGWLCVPGGLHR